jgi:hypothetical protein
MLYYLTYITECNCEYEYTMKVIIKAETEEEADTKAEDTLANWRFSEDEIEWYDENKDMLTNPDGTMVKIDSMKEIPEEDALVLGKYLSIF